MGELASQRGEEGAHPSGPDNLNNIDACTFGTYTVFNFAIIQRTGNHIHTFLLLEFAEIALHPYTIHLQLSLPVYQEPAVNTESFDFKQRVRRTVGQWVEEVVVYVRGWV